MLQCFHSAQLGGGEPNLTVCEYFKLSRSFNLLTVLKQAYLGGCKPVVIRFYGNQPCLYSSLGLTEDGCLPDDYAVCLGFSTHGPPVYFAWPEYIFLFCNTVSQLLVYSSKNIHITVHISLEDGVERGTPKIRNCVEIKIQMVLNTSSSNVFPYLPHR
jgi:hypothetical protein